MSERTARIARATKETDIDLKVDLDGTGVTDIETGIGFFDHMLTAFGRHGLFDLSVRAEGDLEVDGHHTVEDIGIVAGQAFASALGDKCGIRRFGSIALPMDEALILAAVDISGRGQLFWEADVPAVMVGAFDATLAKEFFIAFAANAGVTLHIRELAGENTHHVIEGMFKAVARAMRQAVEADPRMGDALPTTKGAL
ncbi:imidazoleglycerol-phosphate dehydratase HisB [Ellagibacter isourolithinifaciens]|uniref:imidazoleglycerol-phosphate dehydratase HisB n=1 Tax=Ellagibacter isourolithinifaciens TaxID=2137581 RepID=UPI003A8E75E3